MKRPAGVKPEALRDATEKEDPIEEDPVEEDPFEAFWRALTGIENKDDVMPINKINSNKI